MTEKWRDRRMNVGMCIMILGFMMGIGGALYTYADFTYGIALVFSGIGTLFFGIITSISSGLI